MDWHAFHGPDTLLLLGLGSVAVAWSWEEADETQATTQLALGRSSLDPALDVGNTYGSGWLIGGLALSSVALGELTGSEGVRSFGVDLGRSFLYSALVATVVKYAVQRPRPSGGPVSFPSGHTTSAFSAVPVIWYHLGWPAGVGATMLAASTGLGRLEENRHYLSDVLAGATLGLVIGRTVVSRRRSQDWLKHLAVSDRQIGLVWDW